MAGTVPAGPVVCALCGRTVKGMRSRIAYTGNVAEDYRIYPHRHLNQQREDCEGRYRAVEQKKAVEQKERSIR